MATPAHAVDQHEGIHALETVEHAVAPLQIAVQDDFGVAVGAELRTTRFEFAAQLAEIVDFAIEDDACSDRSRRSSADRRRDRDP